MATNKDILSWATTGRSPWSELGDAEHTPSDDAGQSGASWIIPHYHRMLEHPTPAETPSRADSANPVQLDDHRSLVEVVGEQRNRLRKCERAGTSFTEHRISPRLRYPPDKTPANCHRSSGTPTSRNHNLTIEISDTFQLPDGSLRQLVESDFLDVAAALAHEYSGVDGHFGGRHIPTMERGLLRTLDQFYLGNKSRDQYDAAIESDIANNNPAFIAKTKYIPRRRATFSIELRTFQEPTQSAHYSQRSQLPSPLSQRKVVPRSCASMLILTRKA